jgi:GH43 family beta-xylosidase
MEPLPIGATCYWAPEVTYDNGRFLMYYSVGNEVTMQIRLAVATAPSGPFIDSGRSLSTEEFAIDPHVFIDDAGDRYLFYATDFLTHTHIGTGTVVDRMLDESTLEGRPHPVTRARYDWQVYDPMRIEKGGVRWHTVEGPFVLKRKEIYYEMFSGGNWKDITYGVSYATSRNIDSPEEWTQASDGVHVLPILRTIPGRVIGPGHNSAVRAPDNQQLYCIYHEWDQNVSARVLAIDPQDWAGERMIVLGPTTTPQPAPLLPAVWEFFDESLPAGLTHQWDCTPAEAWRTKANEARQERDDCLAEARCVVRSPCFIAELSLRAAHQEATGGYGVALSGPRDHILRFLIIPALRQAVVSSISLQGWVDEQLPLPGEFRPEAYHHLRIEVDGPSVAIYLDNVAIRWRGRLEDIPLSIGLLTDRMPAAFAGFALTIGWEEQFTQQGGDLTNRGWLAVKEAPKWYIEDNQLWCVNIEEREATISKGPALESYEMVVNAKLQGDEQAGGTYGFLPALGAVDGGPVIKLALVDHRWALLSEWKIKREVFALPATFNPHVYQQFRFRKCNDRLTLQWDTEILGEVAAPGEATQVGLTVKQAVAAFDMVRVTSV